MTDGPFRVRVDRGVLTLALDTPGSDVNVFDLRAARQLDGVLGALDPSIEVVVITSAKPGSFVNGVGLMMAGAVRVPEDVARLTEPVRRAYDAIRSCRVPTVAAIHGSCFGCGVELALQCRHRVAVEDGATRFYMTEIADYLFVPCFGGTQDLPGLVGIERAIELLIDGSRWTARQAAAGGLVDRAVPAQGADEAIAAFVEAVRRGDVTAARPRLGADESIVARARERIAALPESVRIPSVEALALLARGARGENAYDDERMAAGRTVALPASKAAQGFFFVRQSAARRAARDARGARVRELVLAGLPALRDRLRRDAPADLAIVDAPAARRDADRLLLASSEGPGVDVVVATGPIPPARGERPAAWLPALGSGGSVAEIDDGGRPEIGGALAAALARAGIESARTRPRGAFATARLAHALIDPIARFVADGGAPDDAASTVRGLGFVHPASRVAACVGHPDASRIEPTSDGGAPVAPLADAIAASLIATALDLLDGEVDHPAALDVLARHVLDFPLSECSLGRFATVARARALLDRAHGIAALTSPRTLSRLEDHAARGRDLYR